MPRTLTRAHAGLLLRLSVAWYLAQCLGMVLLGTVAGAATTLFHQDPGTSLETRLVLVASSGLMAGFMGGVMLFPYSSALLALLGTLLQWHAGGPAASRHRVRIQVPWSPAETKVALEGTLRSLGAEALEVRGASLHAFFPAHGGTWRRRFQADEATIDVQDGSVEVRVGPASSLGSALWVDQGRNHRRLERLQALLAERLASERRSEQEAHRLDTQAARLAQAELLLLRAQVEPHFLFNTLAHLRELVRTRDMETALLMVDALVAYARTATERIHAASHPLREELATAERYLELVELRFPGRIVHEVEADHDLLGMEVPVGVLLIPIENAIKHGLEPKPGSGRVEVGVSRVAHRLILEVLDDGVGLPSESSDGTGLTNLRQRLKLAHGTDARLTLADREEGGVQVRIELPVPQP